MFLDVSTSVVRFPTKPLTNQTFLGEQEFEERVIGLLRPGLRDVAVADCGTRARSFLSSYLRPFCELYREELHCRRDQQRGIVLDNSHIRICQ